jgi:2-polyprenyl-3-methyl-5-hydroxy-6-metoxy-1,4-benzoquinol methylase
MGEELTCPLCDAKTRAELQPVRPNRRRLQDERFHVWRCGGCRSLHTFEQVDLADYYRDYHNGIVDALDWKFRKLSAPSVKRLERAGARREHSILDFGCGSGKFVTYLKERGFANTHGYDAYVPRFRDPALLDRRYDVIIAQDVIEHAEDAWEMLATFQRIVAPGGLILIGTPNADGIDPARAERFLHSLHVPYHRHIFSERALDLASARLGWRKVHFYGDVSNTRIPFLNYRYAMFFLESWDNNTDALLDLKPNLRLIFHPMAHFYALFGSFFPGHSECQVLFRAA